MTYKFEFNASYIRRSDFTTRMHFPKCRKPALCPFQKLRRIREFKAGDENKYMKPVDGKV